MINDWYNLYKLSRSDVKFSIPPKIAKNFVISGNISNADNWKAKIILGNSMSDDMKVGQMDDIGYIMISLDSNTIVPVARSDEHQMGYELLHHYIEKNKIPDERYVAIYKDGHNYIYAKQANEQKTALTKFRQYGGPDAIIEGSYDLAWMKTTIDDFISGKKPNLVYRKGELTPAIKKIISWIENILLLSREKNKQAFAEAYSFVKFLKSNRPALFKIFDSGSFGILDVATEKILKAEAEENFSGLEQAIFGYPGIKNHFHQSIRNTIRSIESGKKGYYEEEIERFFGDLKLADAEFNRLTNL